MIVNLCLACHRVHPRDALACLGCGADLSEEAALPADAPAVSMPRPAPVLTDEIVLSPAAAPLSAPLLPPLLPPSLPLPPRRVAPPARPAPAAGAEPAPPPWPGSERRTRARRARLHGATPADRMAARLAEVIVLDADVSARTHLCALLRDLGFGLHVVFEPARALSLVVRRPLAAVFVDVPLDDSDGGAGAALCRHVRQAARRADGAATALVLLRAQLRPIDRVQAELAGCDDALAKPVTRGCIVRVLQARGVTLPTEAPKG